MQQRRNGGGGGGVGGERGGRETKGKCQQTAGRTGGGYGGRRGAKRMLYVIKNSAGIFLSINFFNTRRVPPSLARSVIWRPSRQLTSTRVQWVKLLSSLGPSVCGGARYIRGQKKIILSFPSFSLRSVGACAPRRVCEYVCACGEPTSCVDTAVTRVCFRYQ